MVGEGRATVGPCPGPAPRPIRVSTPQRPHVSTRPSAGSSATTREVCLDTTRPYPDPQAPETPPRATRWRSDQQASASPTSSSTPRPRGRTSRTWSPATPGPPSPTPPACAPRRAAGGAACRGDVGWRQRRRRRHGRRRGLPVRAVTWGFVRDGELERIREASGRRSSPRRPKTWLARSPELPKEPDAREGRRPSPAP